jgi:1-acyl-sn-glycerol-3-phosphate acyltransferase
MIYFVKEELHTHPLIGFLARRNMTIPVRRGEVDPSAVKAALRVLRDGLALYVAPEGTRSGTGFLGQGHDGAVVLALRTGAAVVPCAIWGHVLVFSNLKRLRRTPVSLRFGPAYRFVGSSRPSKDEVSAMTDEMMYRIATLMPTEWRGVYAGDPPPYRYTVELEAAQSVALPT